MTQVSSAPILNFDQFYNLLESELSLMTGGNAVLSRKALLSLRRAAMQIPASMQSVDEAIEVWKAALAVKGVSSLTARRYLESVRALYNRAASRLSPRPEATLEIEPFPEPASSGCRDALRSIRTLARRSARFQPSMRLPADILIFSILAGGLTLEETVTLRLDSPQLELLRKVPLLKNIADQYTAPRHKFLFPLSQGRFTDRSIVRSLSAKILAILHHAGAEDFTEAVTRRRVPLLFVDVASQVGLTLPEIRSLLSGENLPGYLSHIEKFFSPPLSEEEKVRLLTYLSDMVVDSHPRWYAMRLRRGVTPDDIATRITSSGDPRRKLTIYYPADEIAERVGKKISKATRLYISDILFFRSNPADVRPLFLTIGDLAWCYRTTPSPLSPYSAISDRDMEAFRHRISRLSDDMEIEAAASTLFEIGQRVRVTGGPLEGYEGTVLTLPGGTRRQLRILLTPDRGLTLTLDIPDSFLTSL